MKVILRPLRRRGRAQPRRAKCGASRFKAGLGRHSDFEKIR
jgi:hypothetical protein